MTVQDITDRRNDFQAKLQKLIGLFRWKSRVSSASYYGLKLLTLLLAAVVALEPMLENYIRAKRFWDTTAALVLILLLVDLTFRPAEIRKRDAYYLAKVRRLEQAVAFVDPDEQNALNHLSEINLEFGIVEDKYLKESA